MMDPSTLLITGPTGSGKTTRANWIKAGYEAQFKNTLDRMNSLRLFYFKPKSYGAEALVCAESEEQAVAALRASLNDVNQRFRDGYERDVDDMINRRDYTLVVMPPGKVVWTEIS